jgi:predicted dehydrogenase
MTATATPVRVGIVGAGAIAQVAHLPLLARMRGVELAMLCDEDSSRARVIADRFGVTQTCSSADEVWANDELDAVILCTPSHLHAEQASSALQAGKYVLCEKPLATNAADARKVLATPGAESRLVVAMNQRYRSDAAILKPFVTSGELGRVYYLRTGWLNRRVGRNRRAWRQRRSLAGGGALMDLGYQLLDLTLWLLDYPEPERLVAHVHRSGGAEVEEAGVLLLHLADGRIINLEVTWNLLADRERQYLHILGEAGSASLSPLSVQKEMDGQILNVTPPFSPSRENQYMASYRQELLHFVDVVRGERSVSAPTEQLTVLRILDAAYRSADEGREVSLVE